MTKDINFTNVNVNEIIDMTSSLPNPHLQMGAKIKQKAHGFLDWLISWDFVLFLCELGFASCTAVAMFFSQKGKIFFAGLFALLWLVAGIGKHKLSNRKEKQFIQIKNDNEKLSNKNAELQERYNSLLRLMDTLFDAQMTALHDEIAPYVKGYIRTSVYMYDSTKTNFRCFARHSHHALFCKKNNKDEYPNKGWLQSTWNHLDYHFKCDYTDINVWIKHCKEECKNNCYNSECHSTSCISGKKERLPKENCSMLSKRELQKKTMKAKSVWGHALKQGSSSLGIILVEGMDIWDNRAFQKIKELVNKYSNASLEILSLHGQELLELLNATDTQKDMAEGFSIEGRKYAK